MPRAAVLELTDGAREAYERRWITVANRLVPREAGTECTPASFTGHVMSSIPRRVQSLHDLQVATRRRECHQPIDLSVDFTFAAQGRRTDRPFRQR